MNSLKLLTLAAITTGLLVGSSGGPVVPATAPLAPQTADTTDIVGITEPPAMTVVPGLFAGSRMVVASADSGYLNVRTGGGLRREL